MSETPRCIPRLLLKCEFAWKMKEKSAKTLCPRLGLEVPDILLRDVGYQTSLAWCPSHCCTSLRRAYKVGWLNVDQGLESGLPIMAALNGNKIHVRIANALLAYVLCGGTHIVEPSFADKRHPRDPAVLKIVRVVNLLRIVFLVRRGNLLSRRTLCGHHFPGNYRHFSLSKKGPRRTKFGGRSKNTTA